MQYSMNPFTHCEECIKYWCGPFHPFILPISNNIPLPLSFILHVLWNFLFVPCFLSLILYSTFISFTSHISTGLRKWTQFEKPHFLYFQYVPMYLMISIGTRNAGANITLHLQKSLEGAIKAKELTFSPFLFTILLLSVGFAYGIYEHALWCITSNAALSFCHS